ncbi:MAG: hydroxyisourate hydrolase [Candidatus Acidiferrales bacterium]
MSTISTHVLDTSLGKPATGVPVSLAMLQADGSWKTLAHGATDADGRWRPSAANEFSLAPGAYRLMFDTAAYFVARNTEGFYPSVDITFTIRNGAEHHHVPLLLSPYSYSTYRGS